MYVEEKPTTNPLFSFRVNWDLKNTFNMSSVMAEVQQTERLLQASDDIGKLGVSDLIYHPLSISLITMTTTMFIVTFLILAFLLYRKWKIRQARKQARIQIRACRLRPTDNDQPESEYIELRQHEHLPTTDGDEVVETEA